MNIENFRIREAFQRPVSFWVKITPGGFLLQDVSTPLGELLGRVVRTRLLRKLFREGKLLCHSTDGIQARNGIFCSDCLHPHCRAFIRVHFLSSGRLYVFELGGRSAENFIAIQDEADERGAELVDWILRLTVLDHGSWGEVRFEQVPGGGTLHGT
jgi:hypothetical protein